MSVTSPVTAMWRRDLSTVLFSSGTGTLALRYFWRVYMCYCVCVYMRGVVYVGEVRVGTFRKGVKRQHKAERNGFGEDG